MRTKKILVAVIALVGVAIVVVAIIIGTHSVESSPKYNVAVEKEYESATRTFPIPLPAGLSYPNSAPPQPIDAVYEKGYGITFASFFNKCAWERAAVAADGAGTASGVTRALSELLRWDKLPVSVSTADNTDNAWYNAVLKPAQNGNIEPLKKDIRAGCDSSFYKSANP